MDPIDPLLHGLSAAPVDPRLGLQDDVILQAAAARRMQGVARRSLAMTTICALGIGVAAGGFSPWYGSEAEVRASASFNAVPAIAPSSLLLGEH